MPVIIAAHAAAPQIRLVIFRYGLLRAGVPFVLRAHTCRHQEAAAASRESEYGYGIELQQVPGIGLWTADKILKMRKSYGAFKSAADLPAIKGLGPKRM
jgi:Helix-hairpin-helix motif